MCTTDTPRCGEQSAQHECGTAQKICPGWEPVHFYKKISSVARNFWCKSGLDSSEVLNFQWQNNCNPRFNTKASTFKFFYNNPWLKTVMPIWTCNDCPSSFWHSTEFYQEHYEISESAISVTLRKDSGHLPHLWKIFDVRHGSFLLAAWLFVVLLMWRVNTQVLHKKI